LKIALLKETGKNDTAGFCNSGAQVWFEGYPISILTPQLRIRIWIF
jgi:hypothetical protein